MCRLSQQTKKGRATDGTTYYAQERAGMKIT